MEIEAKFLIREPDQFDEVLATLDRLGYSISEGETATHTDRYFDTADWRILRAGWAYRCRKHGGRQKLTLKSVHAPDGAVFSREEIEQLLPGRPRKKKGKLPDGPVQQRIVRYAGDEPRQELFRIKSKRTVFDVRAPGANGARLELDFDRTRIKARKVRKKAPGQFRFMEMEFETGDAAVADALAGILVDRHGLIPSQLSKFERGIQAAGLRQPAADEAGTLDRPRPRQPIHDLIYHYLGQQLEALERQKPLAWEGLDPEGVHKMRVAIRRARTVLKEFRRALPVEERKHLNAELRWLLKELGHVRDADVCELAIDHYRAGLHGDPVEILAPFEEHLRQTTFGAHIALVHSLSSDRYTALIDFYREFVGRKQHNPDQNRFEGLSIADCEDLIVHEVYETMQARADAITPESAPEDVHRLRLLAKRMRYLLEFFRVARPKRWRKPIAALSKMQDELGLHQDAIVARQRLTTFAESVPLVESNRSLLLAMGRLTQQEEDRAIRYRGRLPALWMRFDNAMKPLL